MQITTSPAPVALSWGRPFTMGRLAAAVILGSLLVAACAHVSIPLWFTPVPFTLQTFAVVFLGLVLAPGTAAAALALYLVEGMAGLPVFSVYGTGGFLHITGLTGGYLMAYPAAGALMGILRRRIPLSRFGAAMTAGCAGIALILLSGAAWFEMQTHFALSTVMSLTVVPFVPGEVVKVMAAAGAAVGLSALKRSGNSQAVRR